MLITKILINSSVSYKISFISSGFKLCFFMFFHLTFDVGRSMFDVHFSNVLTIFGSPQVLLTNSFVFVFHSTFDPPEADKCLLASGEFDVHSFFGDSAALRPMKVPIGQ